MTDKDTISAENRTYWKSLGELTGSAKFTQWSQREFPEGASETSETDRRSFLKIMGASLGLAGLGLSGCRFPERKILPWAKQPEFMVPGVPSYYATSLPGSTENLPLVIETHSGRPTKVEGNTSHTLYGSGTSVFAQASVLDLYDPDRLRFARQKGKGRITPADVRTFLTAEASRTAAVKGKGVALLLRDSSSPARADLVRQIKVLLPGVKVATYDPVDERVQEHALKDLTGVPTRPVYAFEKAKRILSLDSDFLATEPGHIAYARAFAQGRKVKDAAHASEMNRLYVVESNFTLTGGMADHRLRMESSNVAALAALIAAELMEQERSVASLALAKTLREKAGKLDISARWLSACVADLVAAGRSHEAVVVAGQHQPAAVHQLAYRINQLLGAVGHTVRYVKTDAENSLSLADLARELNSGSVETLYILGGNPVYDAPADVSWAAAQAKAKTVIRLAFHDDETSADADLVIPQSHYLEAWSDGRSIDGAYVPVQPMIAPLFESFSELEVLNILLTGSATQTQDYDLVRKSFTRIASDDSDLAFEKWLAEGVWAKAAFPDAVAPAQQAFPLADVLRRISPLAFTSENLEVRLAPSPHAHDGRYNNNGWLMECPDPMTKLTWDNAILVSPRLAKHLGIVPTPRFNHVNTAIADFNSNQEFAPVGEIIIGGRKVRGPLHIQPGLANHTVVVHLGFGRTRTGRIGTRVHEIKDTTGIGFDAYPLMTSAARTLLQGAVIKVIPGEKYLLANAQEHWSMEGRDIIREASTDDYSKHPDFAKKMGIEAHSPPIYGKDQDKSLAFKSTHIPRGGSLYDHPSLAEAPPNVDVWHTKEGKQKFEPRQQWGMSIDLNSCIGCNACVVACQSENNIPIVGKDQVSRGREMHWIRLDRYYSAGAGADPHEIPEDPQVSFMGLACVHCELAPCESVCPVNATVHDEQGLNVMAYNRCVGTRYCANNCPFKVRRFNFFDYNKRVRSDFYKGPLGKNYDKDPDSQITRLQKNPDVSVRMRGVMEKCTYCVQRIQEARVHHKSKASKAGNIEDVKIPDGGVRTACQQTCPTEAISFGDVSDPQSKVSILKSSDRDYALLGYLNVRPRTTYLAKLRNPNPEIPGTYAQPYSRQEYDEANPHPGHDEGHAEDTHGAATHGSHEHDHDSSHGEAPAPKATHDAHSH